jgi:glutathione S-transferase
MLGDDGKKSDRMKLIIGNRAYSSWSMRGWLALKHAGLEFEELVVPLFDEAWEQRREGHEFAPSLGKVPILWDGDTVIWDSLAIIEHCAEMVGRDRFWPEDEAARGMARSMAAEMHSGFSALRRELPMNVRRNFGSVHLSPEVEADIDRILNLWAQARARFGGTCESVLQLERGRHHVRSGRHPSGNLWRSSSALRRHLHGSGSSSRRRRRMDRAGAGRALGD